MGGHFNPRDWGEAPPVRQTIPLRSIVCLTGGLGLRSSYRQTFTLPRIAEDEEPALPPYVEIVPGGAVVWIVQNTEALGVQRETGHLLKRIALPGHAVKVIRGASLTSYDRDTGKVLWRLARVGFKKIQVDAEGMLYLCTGTVSAKNATLPREPRLGFDESSSILKVDPSTGAVLWTVGKYEDCFVSGNALNVSRRGINAWDGVNTAFTKQSASTHHMLSKLNRKNGLPQWNWLQTKQPLRIAADGQEVSLLFQDEFQVLKSLAL